MNISLRGLIGAAAIQLCVFAPLGLYSNPVLAEADFDVATAISSAATKADHQKIAAFYEQQAKDLEAKVAQHQKMSTAYDHIGHGKHGPMHAHCDKLLKSYKAAAVESHGLAKAHHDMAAQAPQ